MQHLTITSRPFLVMVGPLQVAGAAVSNTSTAAGVSIKIVILFTHRDILVHIYKKVFNLQVPLYAMHNKGGIRNSSSLG